MSFESPFLLLALLAVPLAILLWWAAERRRMRYALRFTNLEVLAGVAGGRAWRRYVPPVLLLIALAALCVGLARPHHSTMVPEERATVILVLDDSLSMQATDVRPKRLEAAKAALRTFLDRVPDRLRVGFIVFSGEAQVAAPPTADHDLVRRSIDEVGLFQGFGGTAIGDALQAAVELAQQSVPELAEDDEDEGQTIAYYAQGAPQEGDKLASILFLSDGAQTRGTLAPIEGADLARDAGIPVYTIALGTPQGVLRGDFGPGFAPIPGGPPGGGQPTPTPGFGGEQEIPVPPDPDTMRAIAETTGGEFTEARTADSLEKVYEQLGSSLGRKPGEVEVTYAFVAAAAGLLLLAGLLSAAWSPRLP
jgi:Ca-activated chloride channel family protein